MNKLDVSFLLLLVFMACVAGFGTSVTDPETEVLALVFGLLAVLVGTIIGGKCLKPFGDDDSEAKKVLKELAGHLRITAEINERHQQTGEHVGSISLSTEEGALWNKVIIVLGEEPDPIADAFRQLRRE